MTFTLSPDDPFQSRLEGVLKTMRKGQRNVFFVNLFRALFGTMSKVELNETFTSICYSNDVLPEVLKEATEKLAAGQSFRFLGETKLANTRPTQIKVVPAETAKPTLAAVASSRLPDMTSLVEEDD